MTGPVVRLARAEAGAAQARERLSATLAALQHRLEPQRLARDARRELVDAGGQAAQRTADAVRRRPGALAGLAAVAGLFLARHRVAALLRRKATPSDDPRSSSAPRRARPEGTS